MNRLWIWAKDAFWLAVAVALVAGGVAGYQYLGAVRPEVTAAPVERPVVLVETRPLQVFDAPLPLRAEGFIRPFREVGLAAETAGRVTELHPALKAGGRFAAGEVLVRLDPSAAEATLAQLDANAASTEARLALVETQLARAETLRERGVVSQDQLDQLLTQKTELTASLAALKANRESAEIALDRTEIRAPFAGAVLSSTVELGTVANPGQTLATLYSVDQLEVTVPIRQSEAALIPGLFDGSAGRAVVEVDFADGIYRWQARVDRVANALDSRTRTLDVTLRLDDRPGTETQGRALAAGAPPALINAFARVTIEGVSAPDLYSVPSTAMPDATSIWLLVDGRLQAHPAQRLHVDGEDSFVRLTGLPPAAEIVTTSLDSAVDGMAVRRIDPELRTATTGN